MPQIFPFVNTMDFYEYLFDMFKGAEGISVRDDILLKEGY